MHLPLMLARAQTLNLSMFCLRGVLGFRSSMPVKLRWRCRALGRVWGLGRSLHRSHRRWRGGECPISQVSCVVRYIDESYITISVVSHRIVLGWNGLVLWPACSEGFRFCLCIPVVVSRTAMRNIYYICMYISRSAYEKTAHGRPLCNSDIK
jgi:hypothetical protein